LLLEPLQATDQQLRCGRLKRRQHAAALLLLLLLLLLLQSTL
jgi:hypothetical protein